MHIDVRPIRPKLERAWRHIHECEDIQAVFNAAEPLEFIPEPERRRVKVRLRRPTPPELLLAAADAAQNLRTALDWLACAAVRAPSQHRRRMGDRSAPPVDLRHVQFPVAAAKDEFEKLCNGRLAGAPPAFVDFVRGREPWPGGRGAILHRLHEMNRLDKHQEMFFAASAVGFDCMIFQSEGEARFQLRAAAKFDELGVAYFEDVEAVTGGKATVEWMVPALQAGYSKSVVNLLRLAAGEVGHILEDVDERLTWA